jgi:arylformamidase
MADASPGWRDLDAEAREREYSPSSCIGGDYRPFVVAYAERSSQARSQTPGRLDLRYGARAAQRLDLFLPSRDAADSASALPPLLVFIHGGYWQELSKQESAFPAADCVAQGIAYAAIDYTLAPHAGVSGIVAECRTALSWLHGHAVTLGVDAERIVVAGSSAESIDASTDRMRKLMRGNCRRCASSRDFSTSSGRVSMP